MFPFICTSNICKWVVKHCGRVRSRVLQAALATSSSVAFGLHRERSVAGCYNNPGAGGIPATALFASFSSARFLSHNLVAFGASRALGLRPSSLQQTAAESVGVKSGA